MIAEAIIRQAHGLVQRREFAQAWPVISEILNEQPDHPQALYLAGCVMRSQGHVGAALPILRRALSFDKQQPNLWMHYGACLHDVHQYDEAREAFNIVRKMMPDDSMPIANIAASYVQEGKAKDALEWADKALALGPENPIAGIAKAFGSLALGRWSDGWQYAKYLYEEKIVTRVYSKAGEPEWDGTKGKTVVVQADQGLGDMIMFAQCLREMVKDCKRVIVETNERLAPTFARNFPEVHVYGTLKKDAGLKWPRKYKIDAHVHISRLGMFYRKTDEDFPRTAYLQADPKWREHWRAWLEQFPRPWVGIAWKGGIPRTNTQARSMKLSDLEPILDTGGTFVSLAYQDCAAEIARWNIDHKPQVRVPGLDNDGPYDQTLGLLAELDHVITVTTTVAHACGALGRRADVIVNAHPAWRYCYRGAGDGMVWYPENSVRLYRQVPGEQGWSAVIGRLSKDWRVWRSFADAKAA